jgi:hypothetical protein
MRGNRFACLTAQDIVQAGPGAAFIAKAQEILKGISNPPASEQFDRKGTQTFRPADITGSPTGLPNWVMIIFSTSITV